MEHSVGAAPTHSGFADRRVVCFTTNAWCRQMGLNHRRSALQADALPTELYLHKWWVWRDLNTHLTASETVASAVGLHTRLVEDLGIEPRITDYDSAVMTI